MLPGKPLKLATRGNPSMVKPRNKNIPGYLLLWYLEALGHGIWVRTWLCSCFLLFVMGLTTAPNTFFVCRFQARCHTCTNKGWLLDGTSTVTVTEAWPGFQDVWGIEGGVWLRLVWWPVLDWFWVGSSSAVGFMLIETTAGSLGWIQGRFPSIPHMRKCAGGRWETHILFPDLG